MYKQILLVITFLIFQKGSLYAQPIGFSGMEKIGDSKFLVVYDKKNFQDGDRLAILKVNEKDGFSLKKIEIKNWKHKDGRANDLESVCSVPGKKNEFLLVESGYWEGDFGRIFHAKLEDDKLKIKNTYSLPSISPGGKNNPEGDNFEGVVCLKHKDDLFILLGERGGTIRNPNGLLRIGILNKAQDKIDWKTYQENPIVVKAPKQKKDDRAIRSITDLHINKDGVIYASAAIDAGDMGPFSSFVYEVGQLYFINDKIRMAKSRIKKPLWFVDGFKIEALSSAPAGIANCKMSIGTEDENYPGQWRPVYGLN